MGKARPVRKQDIILDRLTAACKELGIIITKGK